MIHRLHPTESDLPDAILYDSCGRCSEQADNLLSLDNNKLTRLWDRTIAVELQDDEIWRTVTERRAGLRLWQQMLVAQRLFGIPIATVAFLRQYRKVEA